MEEYNYEWTDNPTKSGQSVCNTDVLNDCLMHLKYGSNVSNTLTKVPKRIKLELSGGVLTLKAGSQVIIPNGFESDGVTPKFEHLEISSDKSINKLSEWDGEVFLNLDKNQTIRFITTHLFTSGTTPPSGDGIFYNTNENKIYFYEKGVKTTPALGSFPFALVTRVSGVPTEIKQIYNGMGYFGSTIWVDKELRGLIPNGKKPDGSLKSINFETSRVLVRTNPHGAAPTGQSAINIQYSEEGTIGLTIAHIYVNSTIEPSSYYTTWYNPDTNVVKYKAGENTWSDAQILAIAHDDYEYSYNNAHYNKFTNLDVFPPFRAVEYNEFKRELDSKAASKVSKSGDTITGQITSLNKSATEYAIFRTKNNYIAANTTAKPSSQQNFGVLSFADKNDVETGAFLTKWQTDGELKTVVRAARVINGANITKEISVGVDSSGKAVYSPVQLIVTNENYSIWSNGYCIQKGSTPIAGTGTTITFAKKFKDTNYSITSTAISTDGTWTSSFIYSKTVNTVQLRLSNAAFTKTCNWVAVGYLANDQY